MVVPNEAIDATTDRSRRQYLAALGTGAIAALAGCGGDDATETDGDGDEAVLHVANSLEPNPKSTIGEVIEPT